MCGFPTDACQIPSHSVAQSDKMVAAPSGFLSSLALELEPLARGWEVGSVGFTLEDLVVVLVVFVDDLNSAC